MTTTTVPLDANVYESVKECSAAIGKSMTEWLNDAALAAARRQKAAAYVAWETANYQRTGMDELDRATAAASLDCAEW